jgi:hypothetical protein
MVTSSVPSFVATVGQKHVSKMALPSEPSLPAILSEISDLLSRETALDLARAFGGRRLYVPERDSALGEDHPIVQAIGLANARTLARIYGGQRIEIGMARPALLANDVRALRSQRMTFCEIAERLQISERHAIRLSRPRRERAA